MTSSADIQKKLVIHIGPRIKLGERVTQPICEFTREHGNLGPLRASLFDAGNRQRKGD